MRQRYLMRSLYTIVTNKAARGKKGAIVAIVEGTVSENVIEVIEKIPENKREQVKEVTLDLSDSMRKIVRRCFSKAHRVIDRFHVQKLSYDVLQEIRIAHRWEAINEETEAMEQAKLSNKKYEPQWLNGDSKKQLLAPSRYILFKSADKWTEKQRTKLLARTFSRHQRSLLPYSLPSHDIFQKLRQRRSTTQSCPMVQQSGRIEFQIFQNSLLQICGYNILCTSTLI